MPSAATRNTSSRLGSARRRRHRVPAAADFPGRAQLMARVVVTGANRGIGLALVQECVKRGHEVIAACRASSPELDALGAEVVTGVEVARDDGVKALSQ